MWYLNVDAAGDLLLVLAELRVEPQLEPDMPWNISDHICFHSVSVFVFVAVYRGTTLRRNSTPLGPYSRTMRRA